MQETREQNGPFSEPDNQKTDKRPNDQDASQHPNEITSQPAENPIRRGDKLQTCQEGENANKPRRQSSGHANARNTRTSQKAHKPTDREPTKQKDTCAHWCSHPRNALPGECIRNFKCNCGRYIMPTVTLPETRF